ncbi:hypothetical protein [Limosilactobacillus fermentum]|nr:hypothetical protein [Limosilactobacillus fermentum]
MLNNVCELIDDHNLANMRELRRFILVKSVLTVGKTTIG